MFEDLIKRKVERFFETLNINIIKDWLDYRAKGIGKIVTILSNNLLNIVISVKENKELLTKHGRHIKNLKNVIEAIAIFITEVNEDSGSLKKDVDVMFAEALKLAKVDDNRFKKEFIDGKKEISDRWKENFTDIVLAMEEIDKEYEDNEESKVEENAEEPIKLREDDKDLMSVVRYDMAHDNLIVKSGIASDGHNHFDIVELIINHLYACPGFDHIERKALDGYREFLVHMMPQLPGTDISKLSIEVMETSIAAIEILPAHLHIIKDLHNIREKIAKKS